MTASFVSAHDFLRRHEPFVDQRVQLDDATERTLLLFPRGSKQDEVHQPPGTFVTVDITNWHMHLDEDLSILALFNRHPDIELRVSLLLVRLTTAKREFYPRVKAQSAYMPTKLLTTPGSRTRQHLDLLCNQEGMKKDAVLSALWSAERHVVKEGL
jgi:hypothetical protein